MSVKISWPFVLAYSSTLCCVIRSLILSAQLIYRLWHLATSPNEFLFISWRQPHVPFCPELVELSASRLENLLLQIAPPSKFTRRQSLYHRAAPVEALEHRMVLTISVMGSMVNEASGTLAFTYQGDGMNADPLILDYATSNGTAVSTADFSAVTGSVTIAPYDTASHSVSVSINNDTDSESDESFTLTFTDSGTSAFVASGTGTIQDDDGGSNTGGGSGGGMGLSNSLPTMSAVVSQSFDEDTSLVLNITIGDAETSAGNLTLAIDSMTDTTLFPNGTVTNEIFRG